MNTVTVSGQGEVVIPINIRKRLGIKPGSKLSFSLDGDTIRVEIQQPPPQTTIDEGFGLLICAPGKSRRLSDFDVAQTIKEEHDRS